MIGIVRVDGAVMRTLISEARATPTVECCGLLAGRGGVISAVLQARNALQSGTAYEIAPPELFALFRRMREAGLAHMGIYHSHPRGDNAPSARDVEAAFYPAAAYFIISPEPDARSPVRAFRIEGGMRENFEEKFARSGNSAGTFRECALEIVEGGSDRSGDRTE